MASENMDLDTTVASISNSSLTTFENPEPKISDQKSSDEPAASKEDINMSELDTAQNVPHIGKSEGLLAEETEQKSNVEPSASTDTPMADPDEEDEGPPLTHALEALLGGLDQPAKSKIETEEPFVSHTSPVSIPAPESQHAPSHTPSRDAGSANSKELSRDEPAPANATNEESKQSTSIQPDLMASSTTQASAEAAEQDDAEPAAEKEEPREWETDSDPADSSSDDSDDSSDEESEEGSDDFKLLTLEEQAKILMEGDGPSDDEGGGRTRGPGTQQLRSRNEIPEVVIPKPDVTITEDMAIEELGVVEAIVGNTLLIKAKTNGHYRVLESGSVLCLGDRSVFGAVSETLGRVQEPLYSVLFTNGAEITKAKLELGTTVFYSEQHSTYVFTQALKAYKGSDASNLYDEEIGDEEKDFSDDEAEAEHKRKIKLAKRGRGSKPQQNGSPGRGDHNPQQAPYDAANGASYDEAADGPYRLLTRPAGFANAAGQREAPQEGEYQGGPNGNTYAPNRDNFRGRGRGDRGRGRGDRGRGARGRGDRGRGRGGFSDRPGSSNGHSHPPQPQQAYPPSMPNTNSPFTFTPSLPVQGSGYPQSQHTVAPSGYNNMAYSPHQPQQPSWPQFPPQQPAFPQTFPNMPNMANMQNMWQQMQQNMQQNAPTGPGAGVFNPAFFNSQAGAPNQWNPQGPSYRGRGRGSSGS